MDLCERMRVRIGIIAVPAENAQAICNLLIESGVLAIWNFAPVHLEVPEGVLVHNENLAASSRCFQSSFGKGLRRVIVRRPHLKRLLWRSRAEARLPP